MGNKNKIKNRGKHTQTDKGKEQSSQCKHIPVFHKLKPIKKAKNHRKMQ